MKFFNCHYCIPLIAKQIALDLLYLDLLKVSDERDLTYIYEFLSEEREQFPFSCKSTSTLIRRDTTYIRCDSRAIYREVTGNLPDMHPSIIDFLLCFNHKVAYLSNRLRYGESLHKILNRHSRNKSIVLLHDKIFISDTKSILKTRLTGIYCRDPVLKKASQILLTLPVSPLNVPYREIVPQHTITELSLETCYERKLFLYFRKLYNYKKSFLIT